MSVCDNCREETVPKGCNKTHKTYRETMTFPDGSVFEVCSKLHRSFKIKSSEETKK